LDPSLILGESLQMSVLASIVKITMQTKTFLKTVSFVLVLSLALLGFSSNAKAEITVNTDNLQAAISGESPLVPANKPLNKRTPYLQSNYYVALKTYADNLEGQVKKGYKYSSSTTTKVVGFINTKLANSLQSIKDRRMYARTRIDNLSFERQDQLYVALDEDVNPLYEQVETTYINTQTSLATKAANSRKKINSTLKNQIRKVKKNKRLKKAKKAKKVKALKQSAKSKLQTVNSNLQTKLVELDDYYNNSMTAIDEAYTAATVQIDEIVAAEVANAIQALNEATDAEITHRGKQRGRLQTAINKLSENTAGKVGENSTGVTPDKPGNTNKSDTAKKKAQAKAKAKAKAEAKKKAQARKRFCAKPANKKKKRCMSYIIIEF
jgi:hypothetical protein